ncbi:mucin-16 isoform X3 [Drosophila obscura]|uniref:mucin-16 isoform X3 n=1 Tax=Drosophila obscura TaxID=7282 RepID=UPI001BB1FFD5|nr:mucin-16 isoform X3 [Drosophila obscura]
MQAALMLRSKSRVARRRKLRKLGGRLELPSNVATKEIAPFPRYPPESWCAQGRAAWLERGRRCSVQDQQQQQATLSRRWVKRNRIQDASLGGSSDDEDFLGVLRGPSTFANAFLYVGLGTVALGLVIAFVGTGEKGFKTVELRLIGPSLIGIGLICCILRILFCICPSHCISSSKKARKKNGNKIDADHTTSLLRNESKRVSIARGTSVQPKYPIAHKRSQSKMLNEGMEALRQIATTSLFMQNDQKTAINRVVPIINEPDSGDAPLEMKKLQTALSACEMSEEEQEEKARQQRQIAKRTTTATTAVTSSTTKDPTTTTIPTKAARATTLSTVDERPDSKLVRQRVALQQQRQQPQQQQQVKQEQHPAQQVSKSQSLSSSSTVKDSLDGMVVVEETSLIDATSVATGTVPVPAAAPVSVAASAPAPLPSSCSTGAIPRLKTNNSVSFTSSQATRPGISTGATPKTTPTSARLPTSQSHPTSYDLPPALPHTYSASATVRGPLGMSMSTSTYAMPTSKVGPLAAAAAASATSSAYAAMPPTTTTISLLPLPAPPTMATAMHSIPGQVPEGGTNTTTTTHTASLSLSLMQPTPMRPSSASSMAMSTSSFSTENKSHPSSASTTRGRGGQLLAPPKALTSTSTASTSTSSKCEPELVLSPAKLGQ